MEMRKHLKRALIIPDCHIPFEDKRAYELMLWVAQDTIDPDEIVILGDYADFWDLSTHAKEPGISSSTAFEVESVIDRLIELRTKFPKAKIVYIEGNHEYRLARFIRDTAPQLFGIKNMTLPGLLDFDDLGIKYIPYGPSQKYKVLGSSLYARHEPLGGGIHCAHGSVVKAQNSIIFGHTHRIQESQIVSIDGENFRGISSGWLGNVDSPVMQYVKNHHQWALAFSDVVVMDDGTWFNQLHHIINYKVIVDGLIYEN